jgi:glutathione peroxidase
LFAEESVMWKTLVAAGLFGLGLEAAACAGSLFDTEVRRLTGAPESLCQYRGQVVLAVNTASACGYTPQYEGLEALYQRYRDRGLVVLGFPSDQFGGQEPGSEAEIARFCKINYGVSFPMFGKSAVRGEQAIPFYQGLIAATGEEPRWNFHKYLIGRDGRSVRAFASDVKPDSPELIRALDAALAAAP